MERPHPDEVAAAALPTATLHEAYGRRGALPAAIKPVDPSMRLCGPAVTVRTMGGQNLRLHEAMYVAEPGDVLVVDASEAVEYGYWGEIMTWAARKRGLGGLVINGGVRDRDGLVAVGFPVFSNGVCIRGTSKDPDAPGAVNCPIAMGGVTVEPGDLVVGDADGVVAIRRLDVPEVVAAAQRREEREKTLVQMVLDGVRTLDFI
jgi:4-hydroxy-4-methyl-2-oxoglutarate aldolase